MKIRTKILRICLDCKEEQLVRKDGAGLRCRSCQCKLNSINAIGRFKDIAGLRSGRLIAVKPSHQVNKQFWWICKCDCGNEINISGNRLRSGKTKSCGCIVKVQGGLSTSPTYRSWSCMKQRCYDKYSVNYYRYGGQGTSVCDKWLESFNNFLHDMGERPKGKTLDRIDPFGNYELSNCRWSTPKDQCANKRKK